MRTDGPRATGGATLSPKCGLLAPPPWKKRWEFLSGLARQDAGSDRERALAWAGQHLFSPGAGWPTAGSVACAACQEGSGCPGPSGAVALGWARPQRQAALRLRSLAQRIPGLADTQVTQGPAESDPDVRAVPG